jgi:hypothetical protein
MKQLHAIIETLELGTLRSHEPVSGGSINTAYHIVTSEGRFFLKLNHAGRFPNMFEAESKGLMLLGKSSFVVPKPLKVGVLDDKQFIVMEWVEQGSPQSGFWNRFGQQLAQLHLITSDRFGLNHDNYIGSLPQRNSSRNSWTEFYRDERLLVQMELASANGQLTEKMRQGFQSLFKHIDDLYPNEPPSLLHGDLWSGNLMVTGNGEPCIYDPAVYYGHREMDLAMMALFGGFGESWVEAYDEVYPLEVGWRERIAIGQLYPLMVHVNLFGGSYGQSVEAILKRFL